ncbi:MAG TPA: hypothetical protein VF618_07210 [Thermoanaerobaculia bacterium]
MSHRNLALQLLLTIAVAAGVSAAPQKFTSSGVSVELLATEALEGEEVELRFAIRADDGTSLNGIRPAAWIDPRHAGANTGCKDKIQSFLGGSLRARPSVDLNSYYVITLNVEPSIAVIDPLLGFGGSKLLTAVTLASPGADWVLSRDQRRLFVSMPLVNQVAVIDTEKWEVVKNIDIALRPGRLLLQENGRLWVASEAALTAIDTARLAVTASVPLGRAPHHFVLAPDGKRLFVTNGGDGTVAIVDAGKKVQKLGELATGPSPAGLATSSLSAAVYVIDGDGSIAVLDPATQSIRKRIETAAGLNSIQFSPDGRWGFITNGREHVVQVLDAATSTIVTTAKDVGKHPDQVAFTDDFAYVRAAGSDHVKMIRLASLGTEPEANLATFPAGQYPPAAAQSSSFAAAIVAAPEPKAVLVANPADRLVYYYSEGMAAPMGNFSAMRRSPKAALVIDRSLRETAPGLFSIRTTAPAAGEYDVALFLDEPRVVHCFAMTIGSRPGAAPAARGVAVEPVLEKKPIHAGQPLEVQFRLTDPKTKTPYRDVRDLRVLAFRAPGDWQKRISAEPLENGLYRVTLDVPSTGIYYVFVESESLRLEVNEGRPLIFEAAAAGGR